MSEQPLVLCYGGGLNSTALAVGMYFENIRPDLVIFADTGGEKPETYEYLCVFNEWLIEVGFPELVTVRYADNSKHASLEAQCLTLGVLPSLAYGWKTCSLKWKKAPQDRYINAWEPARRAWASGLKLRKAIGYDADEDRRAKVSEDAKYELWYPLIEWGWDREKCAKMVGSAGLSAPPKSACFFCPASTKTDIRALQENHPDLFRRAMEMERVAAPSLGTVKGLGRRFSWTALTVGARVVCDSGPEMPCDCFD